MKENLKALIVDDEDNARILLNKLLEETLFFKEIRYADSADAAYSLLMHFEPDIIFLDIKMPGKDGFEFIQDLPGKHKIPKIVFVTAYDQYAIKAIKSRAFDYLLKPVNRIELEHCLRRFADETDENADTGQQVKIMEAQKEISRIRVNTRNETLFINPDDILFCKAEGNYTTVFTGRKQILCSMNLGKIADLLPKKGFIRVGRSFIINFEYIIKVDHKKSSILLARNDDSVTIKISRQHLKDLDQL